MKVILKPCIKRVKMGGGFMENIFDCNEGKMQMFLHYVKYLFSTNILALGFGLFTGGFGLSPRSYEESHEVNKVEIFR